MASRAVENKILDDGLNILTFVVKGEDKLYKITVNKNYNTVLAEQLIETKENIDTLFSLPPQELNDKFIEP